MFSCAKENDWTALNQFADREYKQRRRKFLEWIHEVYRPHLVLYAGSGFDQIPRDILGEQTVIHLSREEEHPGRHTRSYTEGYFKYLGNGIKLGADFRHIPLKDKSIEIVYVHDSPFEVTAEATGEFNRILKEDGILILDSDCWTMEMVNYFLLKTTEYFYDVAIPGMFCNPDDTWRRVVDTQSNPQESGCESIIGYAHTLKRTQDLLNCIPYHRRSITAQCFGIFKKHLTAEHS
ncbi:MAG: hypothetical protein G01um101448_805 [Parcubacteria group bacterium Gr01-1014_48]|nr:MAG: hypothetical protein Greene041614_350 [Parcubacteria group bacterium Greene0416_14]TSC73353.1 MAG: hypothetical protein G01um101448_805 [Parcubacteria group bacterium Gr01-1014_48]TSD01318.1 MAG: hypothetical protein Greene101415_332 [Parcubacteria group bacterium Greene1014_15]TSD08005.1 MAG: hypothetical protein Greene07144_493 [Parcubacteria group bacterium Greene0714_4]